MARRCTVCSRPDAGIVNALLTEGRSARSVALERGLSEDAMQRHAMRHLRRPVEQALARERQGTRHDLEPREEVSRSPAHRSRERVAAAVGGADPLDELVDALREQALAGNPAIVHQYRLSLAAQADARHAIPPLRTLASEPEWVALRTRLLEALEPYPEATAAVVRALGAS